MTSQTTINSQEYQGTVADLLDNAAMCKEVVNVWTPHGAMVILPEEELRGMIATLEIEANPRLKAEILEGMATPLSECIDESAVDF